MAYTYTYSDTASLSFPDFLNLFATAAYGGFIGVQTATTYEVTRDGRTYVFEGTNFSYTVVNGQSLLTGGTLASLNINDNGVDRGTISNLNIDNSDLANAFLAELNGTDPFALETLFLTDDWVFEGNDGAQILTANDTSAEGYAIPPSGNDIAYLYGGNDVFDLGAGNDSMWGGAGQDRLYGGTGDDLLGGGTQRDTLFGGDGEDRLYGGSSSDTLYGGEGDDILRGLKGKDTLYGEAGSDRLLGGNKSDTLFGGTGDDTLDGGKGNDQLTGGAGADIFVFNKKSANDIVTDYDYSEDTTRLEANNFSVDVQATQVILTHDGRTVTYDNLSLSTQAEEDAFLASFDFI